MQSLNSVCKKNVHITTKYEHINKITSNGNELMINANDNSCNIENLVQVPIVRYK